MITKDPFAPTGLPVGLTVEAERKLRQFDQGKVAMLTLLTIAALYETVAQGKTSAAKHVSVTLSMDTSAYTAGDVLADTQEVAGAVGDSGGAAILNSVVLLDKDDQAAAAIDLVFFRSSVSLGTENAAPSISDANAAEILGIVNVPAANFIDVGGAKVATVTGVNLLVEPTTGTSIYVAAICRGTPTQTASGIVLNLGFSPIV